MANNDAYEQRRQELLKEYEQYLVEHGGAILLSPDVTIRLDFLNRTQLENKLLLELILVQLGGIPGPTPPPGPESTPPVEVTVKTKWEASEPEEIFKQEIRTADTFYSDRMVDWRQGKRICFYVESTLDQPVQIQVIGNKTDNKDRATSIGPAQTCPANDNISLSPAWDQWHPYMGIKIVAAAAPTSGLLTISVIRQD